MLYNGKVGCNLNRECNLACLSACLSRFHEGKWETAILKKCFLCPHENKGVLGNKL